VTVGKLLGLLVVAGVAGLLTFGFMGCKKKEEVKKGETIGGGTGRDDAEAGSDWRKEKKEEKKADEKKGEDGPRDEKKTEGKKTEAMASKEGTAPEPVIGKRPKSAESAREQGPPAGILTAGSFDDNLYPEPYRAFIRKLGQDNPHIGDLPGKLLGHSLVIAVTNGDGRPVGNARVTAASNGGGASVTLRTRSNGTAVVLSSWDGLAADEDMVVTVAAGDSRPVRQTVPRRAQRWQVTLPAAQAALPKNLDLVLVLDTTGSMGDELEYLKSEVKSIAAAVHEQFPGVDKRFGLVVYRDEGMGDEYVTRTFPFTSSLNTFRKNLSAQSAAGGGDIPEAMHRGLEEADKLEWRDGDTARVLFLIADAPPHGQHGRRTLDLVDRLRKRGVVIYPVAASCSDPAATVATEFYMRTAALLTGGQYLFLTDDSGVGEGHGEPHIPYYHVQKLNQLMVRMIASELSGKRIEPKAAEILRTVGRPINRGRK
jgi:Mg-chelatase subunit ChlD